MQVDWRFVFLKKKSCKQGILKLMFIKLFQNERKIVIPRKNQYKCFWSYLRSFVVIGNSRNYGFESFELLISHMCPVFFHDSSGPSLNRTISVTAFWRWMLYCRSHWFLVDATARLEPVSISQFDFRHCRTTGLHLKNVCIFFYEQIAISRNFQSTRNYYN